MRFSTILHALHHHAQRNPKKIAFSFLEGRDASQLTDQIDYHTLFSKAWSLAQHIRTVAQPQARVLLCYPAGIDFIVSFYACLLAQTIAVPVLIPNNLGMIKKFNSIFKDSTPSLLLTDQKTLECCQTNTTVSATIPCIATNTLTLTLPHSATEITLPPINPEDIAFLQYTSGSTSDPKGVVILHKNLLHNVVTMAKAYQLDEQVTGLGWLPHTHDMGLVGLLLEASFIGAHLYIISPMVFIRRPLLWAELMSKYAVQITAGPGFALQLCMQQARRELPTTLDLTPLRCMIIGSEMLNAKALHAFAETFKANGFSTKAFVPSYGLAEGTLMASARFDLKSLTLDAQALQQHQVVFVTDKSSGAIEVLSCGNPYQDVKIISPEGTKILPDQHIGEVWISSDSVAQGYWHKPEINATLFDQALPNALESSPRFFKTGDLGFMHEGELYITGRIKNLIIINGLNFYPHDLELSVQNADPLLAEESCVAFAHRTAEATTDGVVILVKQPRQFSEEQVKACEVAIRKQLLKEFQLVPHDVRFVNFSFPKTTSGKLQRGECAKQYQSMISEGKSC